MADESVQGILNEQTKAPEIDWDDPKAVAAARGDVVPGSEPEAKPEAKPETKPESKPSSQSPKDSETKAKEPESKKPETKAKEPEAKDEDVRIPKARFDEVNSKYKQARTKLEQYEAEDNARRQAAERELAEKQAKEAEDALQAQQNQIKELNRKFTVLVSENKIDEATEIQNEISTLNQEIMRAQIEEAAVIAGTNSHEQLVYNTEVAKLEAEYPMFNPDKPDEYDDALAKTVMALKTGLEQNQGMSPADALLSAVNTIMPNKTKDSTEDATKNRNKEAVERGLRASESQPQSLEGVGDDSDSMGMKDKIQPSKLTEKEFEALPESKRAQLRGDFL